MNDLISRQAAIEIIHTLYPSAPIMRMNRKRWEEIYKPYIECEKALEWLPSAQPEIIRCKDCKYYIDNRCYKIKTLGDLRGNNDYCSYAERREK